MCARVLELKKRKKNTQTLKLNITTEGSDALNVYHWPRTLITLNAAAAAVVVVVSFVKRTHRKNANAFIHISIKMINKNCISIHFFIIINQFAMTYTFVRIGYGRFVCIRMSAVCDFTFYSTMQSHQCAFVFVFVARLI